MDIGEAENLGEQTETLHTVYKIGCGERGRVMVLPYGLSHDSVLAMKPSTLNISGLCEDSV